MSFIHDRGGAAYSVSYTEVMTGLMRNQSIDYHNHLGNLLVSTDDQSAPLHLVSTASTITLTDVNNNSNSSSCNSSDSNSSVSGSNSNSPIPLLLGSSGSFFNNMVTTNVMPFTTDEASGTTIIRYTTTIIKGTYGTGLEIGQDRVSRSAKILKIMPTLAGVVNLASHCTPPIITNSLILAVNGIMSTSCAHSIDMIRRSDGSVTLLLEAPAPVAVPSAL